MNRRLARESTSRFCTRNAAKKTISASFANSPGWMEKPATRIQIFAPFTSLNRPGRIAGRARNARPAAASVYAYRASARWSRTISSTATNSASPMQVHSTWTSASPDGIG